MGGDVGVEVVDAGGGGGDVGSEIRVGVADCGCEVVEGGDVGGVVLLVLGAGAGDEVV